MCSVCVCVCVCVHSQMSMSHLSLNLKLLLLPLFLQPQDILPKSPPTLDPSSTITLLCGGREMNYTLYVVGMI